MMARYHQIQSIVREQLQLSSFTVKKENIHQMLKDIAFSISSWKGVDLKLCQKEKQSFKQYKRTATNWYNRNKPKIFGTYFFYPLIFHHILNVCFILFYFMSNNHILLSLLIRNF